MKTKIVRKRQPPKTPEEFYALGARLDAEAKALQAKRPRGFVFKARTWEDLERWENRRLAEVGRQTKR